MLDPDGSGLLIAASHSSRTHEEGDRYSIQVCMLKDAALSLLHLGLSLCSHRLCPHEYIHLEQAVPAVSVTLGLQPQVVQNCL